MFNWYGNKLDEIDKSLKEVIDELSAMKKQFKFTEPRELTREMYDELSKISE